VPGHGAPKARLAHSDKVTRACQTVA
jgi:hypothetical protein